MSARLVVSRTSPKDIKIRGLFVWLDGREVADISYGETREFELEPGEHRLRVTNQLYNKEEAFTLADGEAVSFESGNTISGFWAIVLGWSGFVPYKVFLIRAPNQSPTAK